MTDMTESTELQAFKRPKDGYKVTVKISLCICVVLSWGIERENVNSYNLLVLSWTREEKFHNCKQPFIIFFIV